MGSGRVSFESAKREQKAPKAQHKTIAETRIDLFISTSLRE
jgi:hypothetical protein